MENYAPNYMGQLATQQKRGKNQRKTPKNPFSFFLDEKVNEMKEKGFTITSKSDAIQYANTQWQVCLRVCNSCFTICYFNSVV